MVVPIKLGLAKHLLNNSSGAEVTENILAYATGLSNLSKCRYK